MIRLARSLCGIGVVITLLGHSGCSGHGSASPNAANPDSGWINSRDGRLSLRLRAWVGRYPERGSIRLAADLRNNSSGPLDVCRPFPGGSQLTLRRDGRELGCQEPIASRPFSCRGYVTLAPGAAVCNWRDIWLDNYIDPKTKKPPLPSGNYSIEFTYASGGAGCHRWDCCGYEDLCAAEIAAGPIALNYRPDGTPAAPECAGDLFPVDSATSPPWAQSEGGSMSLRLLALPATVTGPGPIALVAELRNNGRPAIGPIEVEPPFREIRPGVVRIQASAGDIAIPYCAIYLPRSDSRPAPVDQVVHGEQFRAIIVLPYDLERKQPSEYRFVLDCRVRRGRVGAVAFTLHSPPAIVNLARSNDGGDSIASTLQRGEPSGWITSDDGGVSMRLTAATAGQNESRRVVLAAELRNNGQTPAVLLRPFADTYRAWATQISVRTSDGGEPIAYSGPTCYRAILGPGAFAEVQGGASIRDVIELPPDRFPKIIALADGRIRFRYGMSEDDRRQALSLGMRNLWTGIIASDVPIASGRSPPQ